MLRTCFPHSAVSRGEVEIRDSEFRVKGKSRRLAQLLVLTGRQPLTPPSPRKSGAREKLAGQPFRDALLRIGARFRVGTDMALLRQASVGGAPDCVQRKVGAIEIVIGTGIDHHPPHLPPSPPPIAHLPTT